MTGHRLADAVAAAAGFLRGHQRADGGWGYHTRNQTSFTEPTAWAILALREEDRRPDPALARAVEFLLTTQHDDGGWANVPGMPADMMTARVVTCTAGLPWCAGALARGADWLVRNELAEGGWGWCYGTTGFLETAAYAVVALSAAHRLHGVDRLVRYVHGLQCADGGWGSHVPEKVGFRQRSQMSVTPLGVVALRRLGVRPDSDQQLRASIDLIAGWVARGAVTTAYSLAMVLWALREVGPPGPAATEAARLAVEQIRDDGSWGASIFHTAMMCDGLRWLASATA